jgi:NodT family efflux transporter outer membrane factor (OMF) lipoprotein
MSERAPKHALAGLCMIAGMIGLTGCAAGPDYVKPQDPDAPGWRAPMDGGLAAQPADPAALAAWWKTLDDPVLADLIARTAAGNPGLAEARARVREARARRGVTGADRFPTLDASASARSTRAGSGGARTELYAAGFDAGWELDVFGGIRRSVEAATADVQAAQEGYADVLVSLFAEVALNYVEARTFEARLRVAEASLGAQTETYDLARWRAQAGLATQFDVAQAEAVLEESRARVPSLRAGLVAARNRLAVLLGQPPSAFGDLPEGGIVVAPRSVAVGVPADTLRRRPDVRQAERQLAAQTARIGVAQAARLPSLNLTGTIGLEALAAGDLFTAQSRTDSFGAGLLAPIFHAGALKRGVEVQDALTDQALARYRSAVLTALEDVENALTAYAREQERRRSLVIATDAASRAATLAQDQYTSGLIDFSDVLTAERNLLSFQDELAQSDGEVTSDLIRLYKALGGGWTPGETPPA